MSDFYMSDLDEDDIDFRQVVANKMFLELEEKILSRNWFK